VNDFLQKFVPSAVKVPRWGIGSWEVDPEMFQDAYDFLFNTDPIVYQASQGSTWTEQHQPAPASVYSPPPPPMTTSSPSR
jgi:hypothetical protein